MTPDTSKVIEFEQSPARVLLIVLAGVLMTAVSLALAFGLAAGARFEWVALPVGVVGAVFFGICTLYAVWRLLTARGAIVTIAPQGIRDTRVADEFISWRSITNVSSWEYSGQKVMVLAVDPIVESGLSLTRAARWTRGANRALGADGLCVAVQGLKTDYNTLLATTLAYWEARRGTRR